MDRNNFDSFITYELNLTPTTPNPWKYSKRRRAFVVIKLPFVHDLPTFREQRFPLPQASNARAATFSPGVPGRYHGVRIPSGCSTGRRSDIIEMPEMNLDNAWERFPSLNQSFKVEVTSPSYCVGIIGTGKRPRGGMRSIRWRCLLVYGSDTMRLLRTGTVLLLNAFVEESTISSGFINKSVLLKHLAL